MNKHAPMKQKYLKANQGRFMTKDLHKAIMKQSRLRNTFQRDTAEIQEMNTKSKQIFVLAS